MLHSLQTHSLIRKTALSLELLAGTPPQHESNLISGQMRTYILLICLVLFATQANAQFSKSPWPKQASLPNISWEDLNGAHWSAKDEVGKVVILNFWATWCAPCLMELPTLQTLYEISDPAQVSVISINVRQQKSQVLKFISNTSLSLPVVLDSKGDIAKSFGVKIYPTTVLIDSKGVARWKIEGDVDWTTPLVNDWIKSLDIQHTRR